MVRFPLQQGGNGLDAVSCGELDVLAKAVGMSGVGNSQLNSRRCRGTAFVPMPELYGCEG